MDQQTSPEERAMLRTEQVKLLYDQSRISMFATIANSIIVTILFWSVTNHSVLIAWLTLIVLLVLLRYFLLHLYRRKSAEIPDPGKWAALFIAGLTLTGIVVGSAGIFLFPRDSFSHEVFLAFMLGGMVAGAAGAYSVMIEAFLFFAVPTVTPILLRFLMHTDPMRVLMGYMLLLFSFTMFSAAHRVHRATLKSLKLRFENSNLIADLRAARQHDEKVLEALKEEVFQRTQTEEALSMSEEHLRMIVETMNEGLAVYDENEFITYVNDKACQLSGYSREELLGRHVADFFCEGEKPKYEEEMTRRKKGEGAVYEIEMVAKDGSKTPVLVSSKPLLGDRGCFKGAVVAVTDISALKQTEKTLRESEQVYRAIFENSPLGIFYFDKEGNITAFNESLLKMSGITRQKMIGFNVLTTIKDEKVRAALAECMAGRPSHYEGVYHWVTEKKVTIAKADFGPILAQDGSFVGGIGIVEDISDRMRAEEALKRSEARYRAMIEDQTELISRFLPDGTLTFVNEAYCRYFGEDQARLIGHRFWHHIPQEDRDKFRKHLSRLSRETPVASIEHRVITSVGEMRWQQWTDRAIFDEEGRLVEIQAVGRDVTEYKRALEALRKSEKKLRRLSSRLLSVQEEERKRIARDLHDSIGSSLSAIKFSLENTFTQMEEGTALPESVLTLISMTQNTIEETRRIMTDLRPSMLDDLGVVATVRWFCRQFQTVYSKIPLEETINVEEDEIPSHIKIVIFRILQEALHNVAKYSEADLVKVSLLRREEAMELTIEDNGIGFDLDALLAVGTEYGKGLGLSGMRERTELSGGAFTIGSRPGEGTTVRAVWPLKPDGSPDGLDMG